MPNGHALIFHENVIHHQLEDFLFNGKAGILQGVADTGTELLQPLDYAQLLFAILLLVSKLVHPLAEALAMLFKSLTARLQFWEVNHARLIRIDQALDFPF
jgi:hypothetical protein